MDREGYFTVRDIVDYVFCPRSLYFRYCIKAGKEKTTKMERGLELHRSFSLKSKRTKIIRELPKLPREYGVKLFSEKYNLSTEIDCILFNKNEAYPVEFKFSSKPKILYNTHKYQIVAQALLIEDILSKRVPWAYIKYTDGPITKISITPRLREKVIKILEQMEEVIRFERIPKPTASKRKCINCFYENICKRL
jgi:CRISPR-associated exonuclease Cas4